MVFSGVPCFWNAWTVLCRVRKDTRIPIRKKTHGKKDGRDTRHVACWWRVESSPRTQKMVKFENA